MLTDLGEKVATVTPQQAILAVLEAAEAFIDADVEDDLSPVIDQLEAAVKAYRQCIGKNRSTPETRQPEPVKACSKCGREFPIDHFPVTSGRGHAYRRAWCQECLKLYYREFKAKQRAKLVTQ